MGTSKEERKMAIDKSELEVIADIIKTIGTPPDAQEVSVEDIEVAIDIIKEIGFPPDMFK